MDFLALATSHIANRFEHQVTYFGWWSNKIRGMRKKREMLLETADEDFQPSLIIEPVLSSREYRRKWAYFIKKVYKDDPLICPKCSGPMRIVEFVEKPLEVKKILISLDLWEVPANKRAPPNIFSPPLDAILASKGSIKSTKLLWNFLWPSFFTFIIYVVINK